MEVALTFKGPLFRSLVLPKFSLKVLARCRARACLSYIIPILTKNRATLNRLQRKTCSKRRHTSIKNTNVYFWKYKMLVFRNPYMFQEYEFKYYWISMDWTPYIPETCMDLLKHSVFIFKVNINCLLFF